MQLQHCCEYAGLAPASASEPDLSPAQERCDRFGPEQIADLYRKTATLVLRRCRRLLRCPIEAEDAMHEVYERVLRYIHRFRGPTVPMSWLYRTAERCCFDRLRKRGREPVIENGERPDRPAAVDERKARGASDLLRRFFGRLEPKLQRVAVLHYLDGLSQERIGDELGWSRRTVGKKLKKIRSAAQRMAREEGLDSFPVTA